MTSLTPARDAQAETIAEAKRQLAALPETDPDKRRWLLVMALLEPLQLWVADGRDAREDVIENLSSLCASVGDALGGVILMFEKDDPGRQREIAELLIEATRRALESYFAAEKAIEVEIIRYQHAAGRA